MTEKNKGGRPSGFQEKHLRQAFKLALLGLTDRQIADVWEVSVATLNVWKIEHPELLDSLKKGKNEADSVIARSLYHRAKGYSHPEDKIFLYEGQPVIVPTVKHYAPDTTACIFWLKNRQKENWRDRQEIVNPERDDSLLKELAEALRNSPKDAVAE